MDDCCFASLLKQRQRVKEQHKRARTEARALCLLWAVCPAVAGYAGRRHTTVTQRPRAGQQRTQPAAVWAPAGAEVA